MYIAHHCSSKRFKWNTMWVSVHRNVFNRANVIHAGIWHLFNIINFYPRGRGSTLPLALGWNHVTCQCRWRWSVDAMPLTWSCHGMGTEWAMPCPWACALACPGRHGMDKIMWRKNHEMNKYPESHKSQQSQSKCCTVCQWQRCIDLRDRRMT